VRVTNSIGIMLADTVKNVTMINNTFKSLYFLSKGAIQLSNLDLLTDVNSTFISLAGF
jgi:hypothetical protein